MSKFIELTVNDKNNNKIIFNTDYISSIESTTNNRCLVYLSILPQGHFTTVKESYDEVRAMFIENNNKSSTQFSSLVDNDK